MQIIELLGLTATLAYATERHRFIMRKSFHTRNSLLNRSTNIRFQDRPQKIIPIYLVDF
jgi:hypothetical protein